MEVIGRYQLGVRLGGGGMGEVFAARHLDSGRAVALKVLRADRGQAAYAARLQREGAALARIDHAHVVRLYEVGTDGDRLFVAMELVDGMTLADWLRVPGEPRDWRAVVAMFAQIGAGLAAVHRAGLVHRDFKPTNVLIDHAGRARVADFGLARVDHGALTDTVSNDLAATLTRTGMVVGTPAFMAPEQMLGRPVDGRADQYSFCVALRQALVDQPIPVELDRAIARGRAFDPDLRFASMAELLRVLAPPTRRVPIAIAIAATLAVGGLVTWAAIALHRTPTATAVDRPTTPTVAIAPIDAPLDAPIAPLDAADRADATVPVRSVTTALPPAPPRHHQLAAAHRAAAITVARAIGFVLPTPETPAQRAMTMDRLLAQVDSPFPIIRGSVTTMMGDVELRDGDCAAAIAQWRTGRRILAGPAQARGTDVGAQRTRASALGSIAHTYLGEALCALARGDALSAAPAIERALVDELVLGEVARAELWFVHGLVLWETGEVDAGIAQIVEAERHGDFHLKAAIEHYVHDVGLTLPPGGS